MATTAILRNPAALATPEVGDLFARAFPPGGLLGEWKEAAPDFVPWVLSPHVRIILGAEGGELRGLAVVVLPNDKILPLPQVVHFFNDGSVKMRAALIDAVLDICREMGYDRFQAINGTAKPDSVWARTFRRAGAARRIGGILEFEVREKKA